MPIVLVVLVQGLAGCGGRDGWVRLDPRQRRKQPPPAPPPIATLRIFTEAASGFSTSDVRDAQEQIVQFNTADELIWTADGTRFAGYSVGGIFINADAAVQVPL